MKDNEDLKKMRSNAQKTVAGFVATATASCAVPVPVADAVILIGEQVTMMGAVSAIYKLGLKKKTLQALVMGALGASGASVVGKTVVSSVFKLIPGVGTVAGSAISASTAGVLTLALGNAFIDLCEAVKKGELTELDLEGKKGRAYFKKLFELSKKKKETDDISNNTTGDEKNAQDGDELNKIKLQGLSALHNIGPRAEESVNICYDERLIGYLQFRTNGSKELSLYNIYVNEEYKGKGVATYVVEQILALYKNVEITDEIKSKIQSLD